MPKAPSDWSPGGYNNVGGNYTLEPVDAAPCYYLHLKERALNGGRDKLSQRELEFVDVDVWPINTPVWASPTGLYLDDPIEGFGLSAEDSAAE
jgi:hypothetical protein